MNTTAAAFARRLAIPGLHLGVALALAVGATPALAASYDFNARPVGPTTIPIGGIVNVSVDVAWTLDDYSWDLPGDPERPLPYYGEYERYLPGTVRTVEHFGGDALTAWVTPDTGLSPYPPTLHGNAGPAGNWSFSFQFWSPGRFELRVDGNWAVQWARNTDRYYLFYDCEGWDCRIEGPYWAGSTESHMSYGAYPGLDIWVDVVPEPELYAMLLAGLGLVGLRVRRRQAAPRLVPPTGIEPVFAA